MRIFKAEKITNGILSVRKYFNVNVSSKVKELWKIT